ncbi:unnamed protein product [marine sediment metagenome]|uniref:Uncharacterized protein n=1 Tax=marine sediment metagenome TaxID=412755 RepID=X0V841_9ZZZZ
MRGWIPSLRDVGPLLTWSPVNPTTPINTQMIASHGKAFVEKGNCLFFLKSQHQKEETPNGKHRTAMIATK